VREYFNILDDSLVNERLYQAFGEKTFQETKLPLYITTTEYKTGVQVVLSQGRIYEAVRASISLPLIFPPFPKDEHLLSDGYLSDPLPIGVALQEGADIVFAMGFESSSGGPIRSFSDYLFHLSSIMSNNLLRASTAFYNLAHHGELISIIPHFEQDIHPFDTDRISDIIQIGEAETEKHLSQIRSLLRRASG
jgi:NTE family protein